MGNGEGGACQIKILLILSDSLVREELSNLNLEKGKALLHF